MSVYSGKVMELVSIENDNEKSYLLIKLSFEQEVELFWEIDNDTAENLMTISEFDENHKYRLSLHTTYDKIKNQYLSLITRTYRNKSERISFACSVDFKTNLESIKNTKSINDLKRLLFLSMTLPAVDGKKIEQKIEQNEVINPKRFKLQFKWVSVAIISVIIFILFGNSNKSYSNNLSLNKAQINKTTITTAKVENTEAHLKNKKNIDTPVTSKLAKDTSSDSSLPYIELGDSIAFKVPEGYVSLTFDDGPSKYTERIVDILKKYNVGGTFFFIGNNVIKHPDYVRYVHSNGYSIGSHSMDHVEMSHLSYKKQEEELLQSTKAIEDITNEKVVLFRPPYEALNELTKEVIHDHHDKMILWNRDTEDWKTRDANKIFNYVRNTEASGSIILLHESLAVIDALPKIIEHLKEQKLTIVSLQ